MHFTMEKLYNIKLEKEFLQTWFVYSLNTVLYDIDKSHIYILYTYINVIVKNVW